MRACRSFPWTRISSRRLRNDAPIATRIAIVHRYRQLGAVLLEGTSPTLSALRAYREHRAAGRRGVPPHAPLDFAPAALQPLIRHDGVTDRRRWKSALLHQSYATRSSTASRRPTTRNARSIWLM